VRELGITLDGELYVEYRDRGEKIQQLGERAMTQALQRLSRQQERVVLFLDGHGRAQAARRRQSRLGSFGGSWRKSEFGRVRSIWRKSRASPPPPGW